VLLAFPRRIREEVKVILAAFGSGTGHVFNLGHGITPKVKPEHVSILAEAVHEMSLPYHALNYVIAPSILSADFARLGEVDGGVNLSNIQALARTGADTSVAGTAIIIRGDSGCAPRISQDGREATRESQACK
jgi:hypothetical protein